MTINEACAEIEKVLAAMAVIQSFQVRPSGDDVDTVKVWVDLGETKIDTDAWARKLEADLKPLWAGTIEVRAEAGI